MHHFRKKSLSAATPTNSRPPTPPSSFMEYVKQGLATLDPRAKDKRALVASSSAVALSIASPPCDPTDNAPDESGSSKESVWRTAYGVAKIAVDIAKDSSDMLPPLKAVTVALSVLIKNYDQTAANGDQIRDIEERVQSLCGVLAYPVGDQDGEEKARREVLRRKLAGIIVKLRPLSEQNGIAKFFKNVDHAQVLNGFVQDLAFAVTDYQQSIHKGIKGIDKTTNRIDETANKIDERTEKIAQNVIEAADQELLGKLSPVLNAGHKSGHHDTCLRGTRESVLDGIMRWAKDPQDKQVFWLNGLAGTGKSTIAQTFSEVAAENGILGASFFCSREYLDRRELKNIFPTLAYQLSCQYPAFRRHIIRTIKKDPAVASNSLISQLEDLIVGPLSSSNISCVIVVDALDECIDDQPASAVLSVLGRHVGQFSPLKFFITGRPEPRIRSGFRLPLLEPLTEIFLLHEVKPPSVDEDIRLYLQEKLTAVSKRRSDISLSDPWPCAEDLTALTKKSSGLFIFASTLVRFIQSEHHEPNERLQLIITSPDNTAHEGRGGIDSLYTQILVQAFLNVRDAKVFTDLRRVLGAVILAFNPLSRVQIAGILGVDPSLITRSLRHLHSVLLVPTDDSGKIRIFHKSFSDFLQDCDRCSDPLFFIDSSAHHGDIALDCLELVKKLKPNPCNLPDFVLNRDVVDLPELLEDNVGGAARYACGHWAMHVRSSPTTKDYAIRLIPSTIEFFKKNAVPWMEVMSLEDRLESVTHGIYGLFDWLGMVHLPTSDLRSLAEDCLRFTMHFFHPIQQSALHIYHSALPLSPGSSTFHSPAHCENTRITGFHGRADAWGIVVRTITANSKRFTCMTTFGHSIAAACSDGTVCIFDSITGVLRLSLSPADPVQAIAGSPDGSILFCAHRVPSITVWDIQTGGLVHTFGLGRPVREIAVSSKGRYLACELSDESFEVREVAKNMEGAAIWTSSPVNCLCWLDPEERLAVSAGESVDIRDVVIGIVLHSFAIRYPLHRMIHSQKFNQLALVASSTLGSTMTIINPQTGISSSSHPIHPTPSCFTFSQTTEELLCGTETQGLQLFNISTHLWRGIEYPDTMISVSSLPNGTVAANFAASGVQLLSLDGGNSVSRQQTVSTLTLQAFDQGRIIATLPTSRDCVVLLEPASLSPLLTIHALNPLILCASLHHRMALHSSEGLRGEYVQLREFHGQRLKWTVQIDGTPSIGGISPSGAWLVVFYDVGNQTCISIRDAQKGELKTKLLVDLIHPLDITFDSESRFYSHHDTYRVPYDYDWSSRDRSYIISPLDRRLPLIERYYDVDDTCEWVVADSKKICWIPPGYIGSAQSSYCWVGCSLVMAGQDGMLRKLTFREPI